MGWDSKTYRSRQNYRVIEKFLDKNVGRLWDDVWSEICKSNDSRSYLGKKIRKRFLMTVKNDIYERNGKLYYINPYIGEIELKPQKRWKVFYICQITKKLKKI